ncbi:signal peptidase II [Anaerotalea alkaliphila]|uniref:Lipoprotein signal peptidase n=1 Tax=Anaerotalea alkaliphila TaxID=2662126 RepID=A0A7X5HWH5_9FIRM|nr:signal peptidase II [Anaerotalea alkaliphila]NDL67933.1 signal peptidase II [Anaerotalea alkaliphila]
MLAFLTVLLLVAFDQLTKYLTVAFLKGNPPVVLWDGVFQLTYVENRGAAFGIFHDQLVLLATATLVILWVLVRYYRSIPQRSEYGTLRACLLLIVAGAMGNLVDRLLHQYVIDMFYFQLIDFPVWNVADMYITCASALLVYLLLFKHQDLDAATGKKEEENGK